MSFQLLRYLIDEMYLGSVLRISIFLLFALILLHAQNAGLCLHSLHQAEMWTVIINIVSAFAPVATDGDKKKLQIIGRMVIVDHLSTLLNLNLTRYRRSSNG